MVKDGKTDKKSKDDVKLNKNSSKDFVTDKKSKDGIQLNKNNSKDTITDKTGGNVGQDGQLMGSQIANKPKLIISNYKLSPEMPKAGDEFQMDLTFYNTNDKKSVRNIKITLNGQEQSQTATGVQTSGSVFSPVNSSNTFYIPVISAKKTVGKTIKLKTVPNAQAQNYTISVQFEYEDYNGNEFTATEIIGVPVVQKSEILFSDVKIPEATADLPIPIELEFYNTGKDMLSTFMITIEGEGFEKLSSRYFVGNFQPGSSDRFTGEIIAKKSGKISGNVVVTYEDSTGEKHEHKIPFEKEIESSKTEEIVDSNISRDSQKNPKSILDYIPYVGVAILILILGYVVYRKKKNKKQEKDLFIDEN